MREHKIKILLIAVDENDYGVMLGTIHRFKYWQASLEWSNSYESGLEAMQRGGHDLCLLAYSLGKRDGLELLREARSGGDETPVIVLTGSEHSERHIEVLEAGASDYLWKDSTDAALLERSIRYVIDQARTMQHLRNTAGQNTLMATVIHNMRSGVVITDPALPDNPIVYVNPGFTALTGYSSQEAIGRNCRFLQGPDTDPATLQEIREAISNSECFSGLLVNYRKDGSTFWNGLVIQPIFNDKGQLSHFVGVLNDVSVSREQLRALAAHLTTVREQERAEMAREVHDQLGQALTGLKMDLAWLRKKLPEACNVEPVQPLLEKISVMSQYIDGTIQSVRRIAAQLRPALLDDLGLEAAIEWQLQEFQNRTGIECRFDTAGELPELDQERTTALFRIFQETLTNVARHAQATSVVVMLQIKEEYIFLTVKDNGRGITSRELFNTKSLGLLGMRERSLLVGGVVEIRGKEGEGTTVTVRVPLHERRTV